MENTERPIKSARKSSAQEISMFRSGFLFPRASIWTGMARIFDFGQSLNRYNRSPTPEEADYQALLSDWLAVGDDLRWAIREYNPKTETSKK